jgi:5-methylcytosine-specific restriction endonuclease McrA
LSVRIKPHLIKDSMPKQTPRTKTNNKHVQIALKYKSGLYTTESLASQFSLSTKQIQRIAKKEGVIRTQAESNRLMAKYKNYYHKPDHLKVKRKQLPNALRLHLIRSQPYCSTCGSTIKDGIRLEIDHIDENPMNNILTNLQVLCNLCNVGKSHLARFN